MTEPMTPEEARVLAREFDLKILREPEGPAARNFASFAATLRAYADQAKEIARLKAVVEAGHNACDLIDDLSVRRKALSRTEGK